mmetsp:Transcript_26480/g.39230  ORF Transcript_26480/g.39230 Transcript_26480/m.39230 type:complete len:243 (+) Transcript_26480:1654-2382(+)
MFFHNIHRQRLDVPFWSESRQRFVQEVHEAFGTEQVFIHVNEMGPFIILRKVCQRNSALCILLLLLPHFVVLCRLIGVLFAGELLHNLLSLFSHDGFHFEIVFHECRFFLSVLGVDLSIHVINFFRNLRLDRFKLLALAFQLFFQFPLFLKHGVPDGFVEPLHSSLLQSSELFLKFNLLFSKSFLPNARLFLLLFQLVFEVFLCFQGLLEFTLSIRSIGRLRRQSRHVDTTSSCSKSFVLFL